MLLLLLLLRSQFREDDLLSRQVGGVLFYFHVFAQTHSEKDVCFNSKRFENNFMQLSVKPK